MKQIPHATLRTSARRIAHRIGLMFLCSTLLALPEKSRAVELFNSSDLTGFTSWLHDSQHEDPRGVFSVTNGLLRISGDGLGYLATTGIHENYRLTVEYRWGHTNTTWNNRIDRARDSGVFLHASGPDGNSHDGDGAYMAAIECNVFEGATGDLLLIRGNDKDGHLIAPRLTALTRPETDSDGWPFHLSHSSYPHSHPSSHPSSPTLSNAIPRTLETWGRLNWQRKSSEWTDTFGFRAPADLENPPGEWNVLECLAEGDRLVIRLNGALANEAFNVWPQRGKILIQSEGSEIFIRRLTLEPIPAPPRFTSADRLDRIRSVLPELDAHYREHAQTHHIPGLIYGVVVDGRLIHSLALGVADTDSQRPVNNRTAFRIASMTKNFTAMAILHLRDHGKLRLDDPISLYVPDFANVQLPTSDSPEITLRHLLKMTGGLPQDDPWADRKLHESEPELSELLVNGLTFSTPPGIQWEYSNLGYTLLGQVIRVVSHQPYQTYITENLLIPLGMQNTVWDHNAVPPETLALGYRWEHEKWSGEPILADGTFGAMGGLITTLEDFARHVAFHLDAWPPRNSPDIGPVFRATRREMHRPAEIISATLSSPSPDGERTARASGYNAGLNWNMDSKGVVWLRHAGGLPGYGSEFRFLPEHGLGLIAFANRTYAPMTAANNRAMDILMDKAKIEARSRVTSPWLRERAAQFTRILQTWDPTEVAAALSPNFFQDRQQADWQAAAKEALIQIGLVHTVTDVDPWNDLRGTFQMIGDKGVIEVFISMTPERPPRIQAARLTVTPTSKDSP